VAARLQLPVELVEHEVTEQGRERTPLGIGVKIRIDILRWFLVV
jgi:hypothetical protein